MNVKAVGLNPVDTYIRSGSMMKPSLPYTPGSDGAGIVKEVGSDVTKYKVKGILIDHPGDFSNLFICNTFCVISLVRISPFTVWCPLKGRTYLSKRAAFSCTFV